MILERFLIAAAGLLLASSSVAESRPRIAIIIDDLGYQLEAGRRAIALPGPLAYAVLPATPRGATLAQIAHDSGKEVLLHLPLEPVGYRGPAEPAGLRLDMSRAMFRDAFRAAISSVPHAVGVSSHRGSLLTRHPGHMGWLMEEIRDRQPLFFVDSYTTHESVALAIAKEAGVRALKRDVFLDHEQSEESITRELERLKSLARMHGQAVGIGHPYPQTLTILERALPALVEEGFELVPISEIIALRLNRL